MRTHYLILIFSVCLLSSCGPITNESCYERIFKQEPLYETEIIECYFDEGRVCFGLFADDWQYFIAIKPTNVFRKKLIDSNSNIFPSTEIPDKYTKGWVRPKPMWFVPKQIENYRIWFGKEGHLVIFEDKESGVIYLADGDIN